MNLALLKMTIKRNWKLLLIFFVVTCLYLSVIISLIDAEDMESARELFGAMGGLLAAFGISIEAMTSPLSYTASTFFGILVMGFTMVFYVMQSNKLIAKSIDDGSMALTLSTPISRAQIVITQAVYLIASLLILFLGILATGAAMLALLGSYNFAAYLNLTAVTFLLSTTIAMLSFFLSVAFCDSKKGVGLSSGIPIGLLLLSMLAGAGGESTKWLKSVSPFGWIDSVAIVNGSVSTWWMYIVFSVSIAGLLIASVIVFNRKRLPI